MEKEDSKLTRKVTVRLTQAEFNKIKASFKNTTKKKLSEYIRSVLLDKRVTVYTRDRSMDDLMTEFVRLRNELSAIGSNFNQLVKRLHSTVHFQEIKQLAIDSEKYNEKFIEKAGEINMKIAQLYSAWLQE